LVSAASEKLSCDSTSLSKSCRLDYVKEGRFLRLNASFSARQSIHISTLAEISVYQDDGNVQTDLLAKLEMLLFYIIRQMENAQEQHYTP